MIVDCCPFFNEHAVLEARLHELAPVVDRFVICEATLTHSGHPKPLHLTDHPEVYAPWADRVEHVVMDTYDGIDLTDAWAIEHAQHQQGLDRALSLMVPGDILIYTDCDEIPRADAVREFVASGQAAATLEMPLFYYYLNCRATRPWRMAKILRWDGSPLVHREIRRRFHVRQSDGGWHFSYLGDIKTKLDAFAHTEYAQPPWNTPAHIAARVTAREDLFGRGYRFETLRDLRYLPQYMKDHMDRYQRYVCA